MTALIGGICIGILGGLWVTRRIARLDTKINHQIRRRINRIKKLNSIIDYYGKEGQTKKAEGGTNTSHGT